MKRNTLTLDGSWDFHFVPGATATKEDLPALALPDSGWRQITVPSPWQAQFEDLRARAGVAQYRKIFTAPKDLEGAAVFLHFGAVFYHAQVWLNGVFLGEHEGGFLPFEFEVSAALQAGEPNELLVCVTAPSNDPQKYPQYPFAEIPHGKQSWYGFLGGIWQSVWLEERSPFHIQAMHLTPNLTTGQVQVQLIFSKTAENPHRIQINLLAPSGNNVTSLDVAVPVGSASVDLSLKVDAPLPWSPAQPALYDVQAQLLRNQAVIDSKSDQLGFPHHRSARGQALS